MSKKAKIADACGCLKKGGGGRGWMKTDKCERRYKQKSNTYVHAFSMAHILCLRIYNLRNMFYLDQYRAIFSENVEGILLEQSKHTETKSTR